MNLHVRVALVAMLCAGIAVGVAATLLTQAHQEARKVEQEKNEGKARLRVLRTELVKAICRENPDYVGGDAFGSGHTVIMCNPKPATPPYPVLLEPPVAQTAPTPR